MPKYVNIGMTQIFERDKLAIRLNDLLDLLRVVHTNLDLIKFCDILGYEVSDLEKYFILYQEKIEKGSKTIKISSFGAKFMEFVNLGESKSEENSQSKIENNRLNPQDFIQYPPKKLLNKIADTFGMNKEWLRRGVNEPFYNANEEPDGTRDPYEAIVSLHEKLSPEKCYFVLSQCDDKRATIVLKISKYKFITIPQDWSLNPKNVGASGRRFIKSFFKSIDKLYCDYPCGRIISSTMFDQLKKGDIYPGIISNLSQSYWHEDILDVERRYPIASRYPSIYGDWFIEIQDMMRREICESSLDK